MPKLMWKVLKASVVGMTIAVTAAAVINGPASAEAGGPGRVVRAAPAQTRVSSQWKSWVNQLVSWLKGYFTIRGVSFSGNGQFCTITMSQGKQSYVCEVNNFTYAIRAARSPREL